MDFQKKNMKNNVFSTESANFDLKKQSIQTKNMHISVGFEYFVEVQKNNQSIHRHAYNHHVATYFQLQLHICFIHVTFVFFSRVSFLI